MKEIIKLPLIKTVILFLFITTVYASYAGQGEKIPQPVPGLINDEKSTVSFLAPAEKGAYRLFVYVFDGKGHFSTANLPFMVR